MHHVVQHRPGSPAGRSWLSHSMCMPGPHLQLQLPHIMCKMSISLDDQPCSQNRREIEASLSLLRGPGWAWARLSELFVNGDVNSIYQHHETIDSLGHVSFPRHLHGPVEGRWKLRKEAYSSDLPNNR